MERGKPLIVDYVYVNDGLSLHITGNRALLPSCADLLKMIDAKFTERVGIIQQQPAMEDLTRINWLADGSYSERWEQGFRRILYHGRTGAYRASESGKNTLYKDWSLPEIVPRANLIGTAPWNNALRMRNTIDGVSLDELYVGFPRAHHRQYMSFEANLPTPVGARPNNLFIGFEVNSGGAFTFLVCLMCEAGQWELKRLFYDGNAQTLFNLNNPGVWARYVLVYDPPFFELWEAAAGTPAAYPLARTRTLDLGLCRGKGIPFLANEDLGGISEFSVGDIYVSELETPRPKRYKTLRGRLTTAGVHLLAIAAAGYLVKIHSYSLQSEADAQTVYFQEETSATAISQNWVLNAREGVAKAHTLIQTAVLGKDVSLNLANATAVNYEIEYSNDDWA